MKCNILGEYEDLTFPGPVCITCSVVQIHGIEVFATLGTNVCLNCLLVISRLHCLSVQVRVDVV